MGKLKFNGWQDNLLENDYSMKIRHIDGAATETDSNLYLNYSGAGNVYIGPNGYCFSADSGTYTGSAVNATKLDSLTSNYYMKWYPCNNETILTDPNYKYCYVTNILTGTNKYMNLPDHNDWYYIMYIAHNNANGYGLQVAYPLAGHPEYIYVRQASGMAWGNWYRFTGTVVS